MSQSNQNLLDPSQWLSLYGDYLFSLAMLKLNHRQLAEDVVQETFLSAIKAAPGFEGKSTEKTWLTAILNNKIIDHYRKKAIPVDTQEYLRLTEESFTQNFFETGEDIVPHWQDKSTPKNWGDTADSKMNEREFEDILQQCIKKMPEKLIMVFLAKFVREDTADSICKEYQISSSNYWVIIHRAKVLVRSCLEKNWFLS